MENTDESLYSIKTKNDIEYIDIRKLAEQDFLECYIVNSNMPELELASDLDACIQDSCEAIKYNKERLIYVNKVNERNADIFSLDKQDYQVGEKEFVGLATDQKKVPIMIKGKGTVKIIAIDSNKKVFGVLNAGIKQTLDKSAKKLILEMNVKFNVNPMDLKIFVISEKNGTLTTNEDSMEEFKNNFVNIDKALNFDENIADIAKINVSTMLDSGAQYENITLIRNLSKDNGFSTLHIYMQIK